MKILNAHKLPTINILVFFIIVSFVLPGSSFANSSNIYQSDCVRGNGKIKSVNRDVLPFNIVDLNGAFDVNIVSGKSEQSVKITADENILPHIATSIQGNSLAVYPTKSVCTENGITVDITVSNLQGLVSSGSDDIKASGIKALRFTVMQGGSGDIELHGNTKDLVVEVSGSSDLKAQFLKSERATLRLTGSSTANVHASEVLDVGIAGVAEINYFGSPKKIIKDITGVGELIKMD